MRVPTESNSSPVFSGSSSTQRTGSPRIGGDPIGQLVTLWQMETQVDANTPLIYLEHAPIVRRLIPCG